MATPAERKGSSPRIKFRWCRTLPLRTKQIHLVLTSVSGTRIPLEWKNELGWYESALVSLSCGLHSGSLVITKKVRPSLFHFSSPSDPVTINERDYKIDPFFVSAHKYSIELFLQTDRGGEVLQDYPLLKDRYLSSPHLQTRPEGEFSEGEPLSASSRRWRSYQELPRRKSVCWQTEDKDDVEVKSQDLDNDPPPRLHKKWTEGKKVESNRSSYESISGSVGLLKGIGEDPLLPPFGTTLRKWDSFCQKSDPSHDKTRTDIFYPPKRALQTEVEGSDSQNETIQTISSKGEEREVSSSSQSRLLKAISHTDSEFFDQLESDTLARVQEVESLLRQSDDEIEEPNSGAHLNLYFKEVTPPKNEGGFGCLITFESRTTSMDDLGSPRALEDVLVSLTSSDTDPKPYPSLPIGGTATYIAETHETNFLLPDRTQECDDSSRGWKGSPKELKYPDSDITINEDENFQYDSLKNEDQKIPLNIKRVFDSENSSDYSSTNRDSKPPSNTSVDKDNDQTKEELDSSCGSETLPQEPNSDDCSSGRHESYNLLQQTNLPSSAEGSIATDPLVLVHPGSLRSETVTESSRTLIESKKSSDTLKQTFTSLRLPSKPDTRVNNNKESALRTKGPIRPVNSSYLPVRSTKVQEKAIPRKVRKSSSLSKTILIIRDKKNPNMNSTGTQTTQRDSPIFRSSRLLANRSLPSSFATQYKDRGMYSPLPDKVNGPWTSKLGYEKTNNYPYCENSNIKKLQKNLYNIAKADQILRKIHPFDYRPTLIHGDNSAPISFPRASGTRERRAFKSTPNSPSRVTQSAPRLYYSPAPVTGTHNKSSLGSDAGQPRYSVQHKNAPEISPCRIKRVPRTHFSIYGREFSDSSADRSSRFLGTGVLSQRLLDYHSTSLLNRSPPDPITLRPTTSLPDLRGPRGESSRVPCYRQYGLGPWTTGAYSSPPLHTSDYDLNSRPVARLRGSRRRRRSFDDRLPIGDESSISTDSLIKEAENVTNSYSRSPRLYNMTRGLVPRRQWRGMEYSKLSRDVGQSRTLPSYEVAENSVADCLRARSETDLRMVGKLTGGRRGKPPYLPYSRDELSLGQIVKVLVPGEGVALARVIYNPPLDNLSSRVSSSVDQNITVVLISEPTNLSGSVITIPLNKFLLAWPKG